MKIKKYFFKLWIMVFVFSVLLNDYVYAVEKVNKTNTLSASNLYALSACLMDADSGRVLFEKNADEICAMASTTKIMTLIIALEYADENDVVTVSEYAASMPDVQLNIKKGEQYRLKDLYYAMMLESYNDVSVAIAEHIGAKRISETEIDPSKRTMEQSKECVAEFVALMNQKAKELGCENTYFITPNGLDAQDEKGKHSTTAKELAEIARYAIKNDEFRQIISTKKYTFSEAGNKRHAEVYNKDAFLNQMKGAIGIKTGFTGEAGYCFVGALVSDGRTFISVVLGSGWPNNRSYKWKDTRALMEYGINNYFYETVFSSIEKYKEVMVLNGVSDKITTRIDGELSLLISEEDNIRVVYEIKDYVIAPVEKNSVVGNAKIYINDSMIREFPILSDDSVNEKDINWYVNRFLTIFLK